MANKNKDNFKVIVGKRIKGFSLLQLCKFSWLCGVQTLPFLFLEKEIKYWSEKNIQNNLYAILYALDISALIFYNNIAGETAKADADDAKTAAETAKATDAAVYAAYAAVNAVNAAYAAYAAADVMINLNKNKEKTYDFKSMLIRNIDYIKNNKEFEIDFESIIYGRIWDNFINGLYEIGCGYWADLYTQIFTTGFNINIEELIKRVNVPESIRALGASDVAVYLLSMDKSHRINEARVILLGEKGSGKTSLATKLLNPDNELPKKEESTEGVNVINWPFPTIDGQTTINTRIWDFAGHVITHAAHKFFMAERCVYVIVYDGRSERRNDIEKWLEHTKNYGGNSSVYIFVNKFDASPVEIDENMLYDKYQNIKDIIYFVKRRNE